MTPEERRAALQALSDDKTVPEGGVNITVEESAPDIRNARMAVYEITTGKIVTDGFFPADSEAPDGYGLYRGIADIETQYIDPATGDLLDKTPSGAVLGTTEVVLGESVVLGSVPEGCLVFVDGVGAVQVLGGELVMTAESVGEYRVTVDDARYLFEEFVFSVGGIDD